MNHRYAVIASDPRIIPGVHHHCDEWCDYCPVTRRCLAFRCTEAFRKQENRARGEPVFHSRQEAITFTRELAEAEGLATEELDALLNAAPGKSDIRTSDPLVDLAWEYALLAAVVLADPHSGAAAGTRRDAAPSPQDVVLWFHVRIYMRLFRALVGRERTAAGKTDRTEDATGSAKLALEMIDRSRAALPALKREGNSITVARMEAVLVALENGIDERFPDARAFVRIGLDVPAAA